MGGSGFVADKEWINHERLESHERGQRKIGEQEVTEQTEGKGPRGEDCEPNAELAFLDYGGRA